MIGTWFASSSFFTPSANPNSAAPMLIGVPEATETRLSVSSVTTTSLCIGRFTPCSDRSYFSFSGMRRTVCRFCNVLGSRCSVMTASGNLNVSKNRNRIRTLRKSMPVSTLSSDIVTVAVPSGEIAPRRLAKVLDSTMVWLLTDWKFSFEDVGCSVQPGSNGRGPASLAGAVPPARMPRPVSAGVCAPAWPAMATINDASSTHPARPRTRNHVRWSENWDGGLMPVDLTLDRSHCPCPSWLGSSGPPAPAPCGDGWPGRAAP